MGEQGNSSGAHQVVERPTVWKAYHNGPLSKMVMSAQLRGSHTPMQQDEQAFTAATLLRTIHDWENPNEGQASLMADLLDTIQFTDPRRNGDIPPEITDFMEQTEVHIINNMSSALAPVAKMFESKYVLDFAGSADSGEFWKAIVSNKIYWKVRRAVESRNRDEIFRTLADFESKSINHEALNKFDVNMTVFARMFKIAEKFRNRKKIEPELFRDNHEDIEEFKKFMTNLNYDLFLLTEVVRALICCGKVTKKLKYLNSDTDVDNLTIRVSRARPRFRVNQITCGPVFIRAEKKTRLKELPEMILNKVHELMKRELLSGQMKIKYEEVFDTLINLNDPALFNLEKRIELAPQIGLYKATPQSMIAIIIKHLRDEGRTIGDLSDAFVAIGNTFSDKKNYKKAMKALTKGLDLIVEEATKLSDEEAQKQFAKDRSLGTFVKFLKEHQPDGIKKYAKAKGFKKAQFLQLANDKKIVVGDMICFWRKNFGIEYAHAGIYAPVEDKKYVVHVQAEKGWLRSMKGCSEVKYDELEKVIAKDDTVFFIRECKDCTGQAEVLSKVEACLFEEPIKYTYNGHYGSCQTFCSKVLGSSLFEELNPEAFLTTQTGLKGIAGRYLGGEKNADELVDEMEKRFETPASWIESWTPPDLPDGESLITTCPEKSRLALQGKIETNCSTLAGIAVTAGID